MLPIVWRGLARPTGFGVDCSTSLEVLPALRRWLATEDTQWSPQVITLQKVQKYSKLLTGR